MSFPNPQNPQPPQGTQTEDTEAAVPAQYNPVRRAPLTPGVQAPAAQPSEEATDLAQVSDLDDEPAWEPSQPQDAATHALPTRQSAPPTAPAERPATSPFSRLPSARPGSAPPVGMVPADSPPVAPAPTGSLFGRMPSTAAPPVGTEPVAPVAYQPQAAPAPAARQAPAHQPPTAAAPAPAQQAPAAFQPPTLARPAPPATQPPAPAPAPAQQAPAAFQPPTLTRPAPPVTQPPVPAPPAPQAPAYQPPTATHPAPPVPTAYLPAVAQPVTPEPYLPPTAARPTMPAPQDLQTPVQHDQTTPAPAPPRHQAPADDFPAPVPAQPIADPGPFTPAPAAQAPAPFEDLPAPIPARPVADPGPFTPAPAAEALWPPASDPFAGFHPSGTITPQAPAPVPVLPGPALVEPYRMPDTRGTSRGRHASEEPFSVPENVIPESKSFLATWLLAWFLGNLGIDRLYLGKIGTGIAKLVTGGGFGVWALYDLFLTLLGHQTAKDGSLLAGYDQHKKLAWIVTLGVWLVTTAAYLAVVVFAVVDLPTF